MFGSILFICLCMIEIILNRFYHYLLNDLKIRENCGNLTVNLDFTVSNKLKISKKQTIELCSMGKKCKYH